MIPRLIGVVCVVALLASGCGGSDEAGSIPPAGPMNSITVSGTQRIIANDQLVGEATCDGPCPSAVTIHDPTGAQLTAINFVGSIDFRPPVDYQGRAVLWERLPGVKSAIHLLNTDAATATPLFEFQGFPSLGWDAQVHPRSKWFIARLEDAQEVFLIDLESGKTRSFPSTAPHLSLRELQRSYALSANDGSFAIAYERGVIEVYDTATFAVIATAPFDPAVEALGGLNPSGTKLVIRSNVDDAYFARIVDVASGAEQRYQVAGIPVGWFSDTQVLIVGEGRASLFDATTGAFGIAYPSAYANFEHIPPTMPWHISAMGQRILLTNIETGEVVEGVGAAAMFDTAPELQGEITWVVAGWANPSPGFDVAMVDLRSGHIEIYSEPGYETNVRWEYAFSADRTRALIPGFEGPGRLLSNGQSFTTAKGLPSFCDDGSYVLASQDRPPFEDERDAALFGGAVEAIAAFGRQPHLQCVG